MARQHEFSATDIDGEDHVYLVLPHPAGEGLLILSELMAIGSRGLKGALGAVKFDAIATAADKGDVSVLDGLDIDEEMIGAAIGAVIQAIGQRDVLSLVKRLLKYTYRDNRMITDVGIDVPYAANYGELRNVLVEATKFNFKSFFGGLGRAGVLHKLLAAAPVKGSVPE